MDSVGNEGAPIEASCFLIIYNDDFHSFQYVIKLAIQRLGMNTSTARKFAMQIHRRGAVAIEIDTMQRAEQLRDSILASGKDVLYHASTGPLKVVVVSDKNGTVLFGRITGKRFEIDPRMEDEIDLDARQKEEHAYKFYLITSGCLLFAALLWLVIFGIIKLRR